MWSWEWWWLLLFTLLLMVLPRLMAWGNFVMRSIFSSKSKFTNRVVLITGGGQGIGKLMACKLHSVGAKVVVWDNNPKLLAALANESKRGIATYQVDVTNRAAVYAVAKQVQREIGTVDVLINNAGIVSGKTFLDTTDEALERTVQVNLVANFWTVKAFLPDMIRKNSGHIVTISSVLGTFGGACLTDYSASKFGSFGFTECLRMELKSQRSNVKTTLVCPYHINTGMFAGVSLPLLSKLLFPPLDPSHVANRIIKAIQLEEEMVLITPFFWLIFLLRFVLPASMYDLMAKMLGAFDGMKTFRGRTD